MPLFASYAVIEAYTLLTSILHLDWDLAPDATDSNMESSGTRENERARKRETEREIMRNRERERVDKCGEGDTIEA